MLCWGVFGEHRSEEMIKVETMGKTIHICEFCAKIVVEGEGIVFPKQKEISESKMAETPIPKILPY